MKFNQVYWETIYIFILIASEMKYGNCSNHYRQKHLLLLLKNISFLICVTNFLSNKYFNRLCVGIYSIHRTLLIEIIEISRRQKPGISETNNSSSTHPLKTEYGVFGSIYYNVMSDDSTLQIPHTHTHTHIHITLYNSENRDYTLVVQYTLVFCGQVII